MGTLEHIYYGFGVAFQPANLLFVLLGTIGIDPIVGWQRFTFGRPNLMEGIGLVQIAMGMFGVSEILLNIERVVKIGVLQTALRGLLPNLQDWRESIGAILRGTGIGFFLGILPGGGGTWTVQDFTRVLFEDEAGIKLIHVPFPGAAEAVPAILGGHIDCLAGQVSEWGPLYESGKAQVLGIAGSKRLHKFPNIPTFQEQGLNIVLPLNHWVSAPTGTPEPIVKYLSEVLKKAILDPGYRTAMENMGVEAVYQGPEETLKVMEQIEANYLRIIKKLDLKPQ
jgi:hypothetical protein